MVCAQSMSAAGHRSPALSSVPVLRTWWLTASPVPFGLFCSIRISCCDPCGEELLTIYFSILGIDIAFFYFDL